MLAAARRRGGEHPGTQPSPNPATPRPHPVHTPPTTFASHNPLTSTLTPALFRSHNSLRHVGEILAAAPGASAEQAAKELAAAAQEVGSTDDVTVVVLRLGSK
eukprot:350357-Chlamydomonas_euryale.AAC.2